MAELHIVGAGLAGLAAAVAASTPPTRWEAIHLYEAAPQAGGRCRSFHDETIGTTIDNGNHLLLGANRDALDYMERVGGMRAMTCIAPAVVPFHDLRTGCTWQLRPNTGPLPWWLFARGRSVPDATPLDRLKSLRLAFAGNGTVAERLGTDGVFHELLWAPLTTAILNTRPEAASAALLRRVAATLLAAGEEGLRPYFATHSLGAALVEPALHLLQSRGVRSHFSSRVRDLAIGGNRIVRLGLLGTAIDLDADDALILAVPPETATDLLPGLEAPDAFSPIVNVHYRLDAPASLPAGRPFLGLVGGTAEWLFVRGDVLSVTVSAADSLVGRDATEIGRLIWRDVATAIGSDAAMPACRVIKERRATILQSPAQVARRPPQQAALANLALAGDWVDTGLPATIESAVRSGRRAVALLRDP